MSQKPSAIKEVNEYLQNQVPAERKKYFLQLRQTILEHLPSGFTEAFSYGMIGYVVPHEIYPAGYHCKPQEPLPFINIASQKHFIGFYHMGIYANPHLLDWFIQKYPQHCSTKLDMGKSCIRFKKVAEIPYDLIAELVQKVTVEDWITTYEKEIKKK